MANQLVRQNRPNQVCDHLNTWSYAVLAVSEAATEQGAVNASKAEAETQAQIALDNERQARDGRCPNACKGGRLKGNRQPISKSILKYKDTDRNVWVSYYSARWRSQLECRGNGNRVQHTFITNSKNLAAGNLNPACGKTRFYSGATISRASGTTESSAKNAAANEAKAKALIQLNRAKAKNCPNNCKGGQKAAPAEPSINKLGAYRIYQVKGEPYVGYAVAYWTVSITCPDIVVPKKKNKRGKKSGKSKSATRKYSRVIRK